MVGHRITDPFFKKLFLKLEEELQSRIEVLSGGGAVVRGANGMLIDAANTALKYNADISYIQALRDVIDLGTEIDKQIYGSMKSDQGDD